jgi:hypothetical protein
MPSLTDFTEDDIDADTGTDTTTNSSTGDAQTNTDSAAPRRGSPSASAIISPERHDQWQGQFSEDGRGGLESYISDGTDGSGQALTDLSTVDQAIIDDLFNVKTTNNRLSADPVPKPFKGAVIATPRTDRGIELSLFSTPAVDRNEVAVIIDGTDQYLDATDASIISHPNSYSKIDDQFTPTITAWTLTAESSAIGIDSTRLIQLIRLYAGKGRFNASKFSIYSCGRNPAVLRPRAQQCAILITPRPVRKGNRSPPDSAVYETDTGLTAPEETPVGKRAFERVATAFNTLGYRLCSYQPDNSKNKRNLIFSVDPTQSDSNLLEDFPRDDETPLIRMNTDGYHAAGAGYQNLSAMKTALRARPEIAGSHIDELPDPPATLGDEVNVDGTDRPGIVLSIDYTLPTGHTRPTDLTRRPYGSFQLFILTEGGYRATHEVRPYQVPVITRNRNARQPANPTTADPLAESISFTDK